MLSLESMNDLEMILFIDFHMNSIGFRSFEPRERNIANSYFLSIMTAIGVALPLIGVAVIQKYGFDSTFADILVLILIIMIVLTLNFRVERISSIVPMR
jgi:hypothetical protein